VFIRKGLQQTAAQFEMSYSTVQYSTALDIKETDSFVHSYGHLQYYTIQRIPKFMEVKWWWCSMSCLLNMYLQC